MTISIRSAMPTDIPALAKLAAASYQFAFSAILDATQLSVRNEAHFAARFQAEWPHIRIVEDPAGTCLGFTEVRGGTLDMLFVHPDAVGRGLGVHLLRQAEAMGAVRLECFSGNQGARRFYEREGWHIAGGYTQTFIEREMAFVTYMREPPTPA